MKRFTFFLTVALALYFTTALGQAPPTPSASAPAPAKPGKRPLTAEELRDSGSFPGELRPAGPNTPQINIPLGKKPPAPSDAAASAANQDAASSPGKIDDRVARCKALKGAAARAACTHDLAASDSQSR